MSELVEVRGNRAEREATQTLLADASAAYDAHDVEALASLYRDDAVVRVGGLRLEGRDAVAAFWRMWFAALPDVSSVLHRTIVEPGRFVVDWTERGTHRGTVRIGDFVIPARGRALCWRGVSIYEVAGGEIASVDYFVDRLEIVEQLVKPVAVALALYARVGRTWTARKERK